MKILTDESNQIWRWAGFQQCLCHFISEQASRALIEGKPPEPETSASMEDGRERNYLFKEDTCLSPVGKKNQDLMFVLVF